MHILYLHCAGDGGADPQDVHMEEQGHTVTHCSVADPPALDGRNRIGAVLIDSATRDCFDACRELRLHTDAPIVMIGPRRDEVDAVTALTVGADDFVARPVTSREIDARLRAIARRARATAPCAHACPARAEAPITGPVVIEQSGLTIDGKRRTVTRDDEQILLTATEMAVLLALARQRGVPISRDALLSQAWGHNYLGRSRIVDNAVQRLRAKIDTPTWQHVHAIRGFGYVLR